MENTVTMSLEEYTKIIVENTNLKMQLSGIKKKTINEAFEKIYNSTIEKLATTENCQKALDFTLDKTLSTFASPYAYTWNSLAEDSYGLMTVQEIKELVAAEIKKRINEKCRELIEEEKENQGE